jgi:aminoglycoside/choline kinase family phosphotransferase
MCFMTKVALSRENADADGVAYRAVTAHNQAVGRTAGEAIDALTTQHPPEDTDTLIIVRALVPDRYFTSEQIQRLQELMGEWRSARDEGRALSADDQRELENLIEIEVRAAAERANVLIHELAP